MQLVFIKKLKFRTITSKSAIDLPDLLHLNIIFYTMYIRFLASRLLVPIRACVERSLQTAFTQFSLLWKKILFKKIKKQIFPHQKTKMRIFKKLVLPKKSNNKKNEILFLSVLFPWNISNIVQESLHIGWCF